jgi:hypothetical protein
MPINLRNIVKDVPQTFAATEGGDVTGAIRVTESGARYFRCSLFLGQCGARASSLIFEQSSGNNIWEQVQSIALSPVDSSGTDLAVVSVSDSANTIEITGHGLSTGDSVVVNSTQAVPGGLEAGRIYNVSVVGVNNIKLRRSLEGDFLDFADAGSGTMTVTPVSVVHVLINNDATSTDLPLASSVRVRLASGANQVQISQVVVTQGE